jgi:CRISPR-associated endonuclease Cas3-HD
MSVVKPLSECIARPGEGPGGLVAHLEAVAGWCGNKNGTPEEKLAFLAGLAHDAAKAAPDWQEYIQSNGRIRRGPPHAPLGAALFAFWAEDLLPRWLPDRRQQEVLQDLNLDWVRMIYRHHGALDDLADRPPWVDAGMAPEHEPPTLLASCDRAGLDNLIRKHFPGYGGRLNDFARWFKVFDKVWDRRQRIIRPALLRQFGEEKRDRIGVRLADLGARLIFADRRHAAEWDLDVFRVDDASAAIHQHAAICCQAAAKARKEGADETLIQAREICQAEALASYLGNAGQNVFTLLLPTGYGKTLTGLRVALEAVRTGRCQRILYIAPYISILSQAAKELEGATGLPVFLHHHLSILGRDDKPQEDRQREDHQTFELMDTWQAPIIATTFNQLFRALFPARAQECLRIPALDQSFVFIDEPQIVDLTVWCAFLRAIALVARERNCQVLFCTATLPPLSDGLGPDCGVIPLVGEVKPAVSRYVIRAGQQPWDAARVAAEARERFHKFRSVGVILNTVRDAVETFHLAAQKEDPDWFFLAAMMLPGHKARIIGQIRDRLDPGKDLQTTGVVCTQVLEAGVNLTFRSLLRAIPVFSSIAQAAGRANRHGQEDIAEVTVFPFHREEEDSRRFVYRDRTSTKHTDALLSENPLLPEDRLPGVLTEYYRRCWTENPHTTSLQWFREAALGKWLALAGKEPFGGDYPQVEVFVPGAEQYLSADYFLRLKAFGAKTARELLDSYLDPQYRRRLTFIDRKRLSALLQQFTVSVPKKLVDEKDIAEEIPGHDWLWVLSNTADYSEKTGLAHFRCGEGGDPACEII